MLHPIRTFTLRVPGAELYYEVRGAGPLLLIIPGGPQDAGIFSQLAECLADEFTVLTFDPRGNSRSRFEQGPTELSVHREADDAAALIYSVGAGPAFVFGTSGGAQVGLALAALHPDLVRRVVAHEPPTVMLLEDPDPALAAERELHDTYLRDGVDAAMAKFFADHGLGDEDGSGEPPTFDHSPEAEATFARVSGNFEYWLAHGMMPLSLYHPDIEALRAGGPPVVVAIGEGSAGRPIAAMGQALASRLGVDPVPFPGDHLGFEADPHAFATALRGTFSGVGIGHSSRRA